MKKMTIVQIIVDVAMLVSIFILHSRGVVIDWWILPLWVAMVLMHDVRDLFRKEKTSVGAYVIDKHGNLKFNGYVK